MKSWKGVFIKDKTEEPYEAPKMYWSQNLFYNEQQWQFLKKLVIDAGLPEPEDEGGPREEYIRQTEEKVKWEQEKIEQIRKALGL
jgi:hypothetical protein